MTHRRAARWLPALCWLFAVLFGALAVWQVQRLQWKLHLIKQVEMRLAEPPIAAPTDGEPSDFEYRPVRASGEFLHDRATLVHALTERGAGYWVITPFRTASGLILVNRGFVPGERRNGASRPEGTVQVTGLLRMSEPGGRFLRSNKPAENRWYSRDVKAIAKARGLGTVAPYFIDAEASSEDKLPVGGLTVVKFRNSHLVYALTWFALAGLSLWGFVLVRRQSSGEKVP